MILYYIKRGAVCSIDGETDFFNFACVFQRDEFLKGHYPPYITYYERQ